MLDDEEEDFLEGMITFFWSLLVSNLIHVVLEWLPGDQFCDRCRVSLSPGDNPADGGFISGPGVYEISWRR